MVCDGCPESFAGGFLGATEVGEDGGERGDEFVGGGGEAEFGG